MQKCWGCKKMFEVLLPHEKGLYCALCSEKMTYRKAKKPIKLTVVQSKVKKPLYVEGFSLADAIGNFGSLAYQLGYTHFWYDPGKIGWFDNPKTGATITARIN